MLKYLIIIIILITSISAQVINKPTNVTRGGKINATDIGALYDFINARSGLFGSDDSTGLDSVGVYEWIKNGLINESNLNISNTPSHGQYLSYNYDTGGFTWIGSNDYLDFIDSVYYGYFNPLWDSDSLFYRHPSFDNKPAAYLNHSMLYVEVTRYRYGRGDGSRITPLVNWIVTKGFSVGFRRYLNDITSEGSYLFPVINGYDGIATAYLYYPDLPDSTKQNILDMFTYLKTSNYINTYTTGYNQSSLISNPAFFYNWYRVTGEQAHLDTLALSLRKNNYAMKNSVNGQRPYFHKDWSWIYTYNAEDADNDVNWGSSEYSLFGFGGLFYIMNALKDGMPVWPDSVKTNYQYWANRYLTEWQNNGIPNWDTGYEEDRWHNGAYFSLSRKPLLTAFVNDPNNFLYENIGYCKYLFDKQMDIFRTMDDWNGDAEDNAISEDPWDVPFIVEGNEITRNKADANAWFLGYTCCFLDYGYDALSLAGVEPYSRFWVDWDKKYVRVATKYYSTSMVNYNYKSTALDYRNHQISRLIGQSGKALTNMGGGASTFYMGAFQIGLGVPNKTLGAAGKTPLYSPYSDVTTQTILEYPNHYDFSAIPDYGNVAYDNFDSLKVYTQTVEADYTENDTLIFYQNRIRLKSAYELTGTPTTDDTLYQTIPVYEKGVTTLYGYDDDVYIRGIKPNWIQYGTFVQYFNAIDTCQYSKNKNDSIVFSFTGDYLALYGPLHAYGGQGTVFIDNDSVGIVDYYAAGGSTDVNNRVWEMSGFGAGNHTCRIRVDSTHSAGTYYNVYLHYYEFKEASFELISYPNTDRYISARLPDNWYIHTSYAANDNRDEGLLIIPMNNSVNSIWAITPVAKYDAMWSNPNPNRSLIFYAGDGASGGKFDFLMIPTDGTAEDALSKYLEYR